MKMRLTSSAFANCNAIPSRFTCDGANRSPPLQWTGAPPHTFSFALICKDPDAPSGPFYHWAAFDIAGNAASLEEGCPPDDPELRQGRNDFGKKGYGGPNPPRGHGAHNYHFTLYALDTEHLHLPAEPSCRAVEAAAKAHALAVAEHVGTFER